MRGSIAIGMSAAAAAVFTHGMVFSAVYFDGPLPASTYQEFFQQILVATEWAWSHAHGWAPMSHIRDFGHFYAPAIQLVCPLIGFGLYWWMSGKKVGRQVWKPLAIAGLLVAPPSLSDLVGGVGTPWAEGARTIAIVLFMVWSVGGMTESGPTVLKRFCGVR